jgi:S-adenosylmethionine:tRNA ribosyltransferase-isomerase
VPGDVLVFNHSKVIPARLHGRKASGGRLEILIERVTSPYEALALMRVSKKPAPGSKVFVFSPDSEEQPCALGEQPSNKKRLDIKAGLEIEVVGRDEAHDDRFRLRFPRPVLDVLNDYGELPLPPYIEHRPTAEDKSRYQTVYAETPGSVAAPTAGLHFDEEMLRALDAKGVHRARVTLHVGTGTFAPVRTENLDDHRMHHEWCEIPQATADLILQARRQGRRVIAVGTTSLRTLESGALFPSAEQPAGVPLGLVRSGAWETSIFIRPGYQFQVVDGLLTNFHLPKSTLLMLVSAFIGHQEMQSAYAHAVGARYRFFSYGDAMFCLRAQSRPEQ